MPQIELVNHNETSNITKAVVDFTAQENTTRIYFTNGTDTVIPTVDFIKQYARLFSHPLLQNENPSFNVTNATFHCNDLKKILPTIYAGFIFYAPKLVKIKVISDILEPKSRMVSYALKNGDCSQVELDCFEKIIRACELSPEYQYCNTLIFDTEFDIDDLPDLIGDSTLNARPVDFEDLSENFVEPIQIRFIGIDIGHGAFAARDIKKNEIASFYVGEIIPCKKEPRSLYKFSLKKPMQNFIIDSYEFGNLSRFINHAPNAATLEKSELPEKKKSHCATANLVASVEFYYGLPIIYLRANRNIQKNEQLFFDYGVSYWKKKDNLYFTKNNRLINPKGKKIKSYGTPPYDALKAMVISGIAGSKVLLTRPLACFLFFIICFCGMNRFL